MKRWATIIFVCGLALIGAAFMSPCTNIPDRMAESMRRPGSHNLPSPELREWAGRVPSPASLSHDKALTHASLLRESDSAATGCHATSSEISLAERLALGAVAAATLSELSSGTIVNSRMQRLILSPQPFVELLGDKIHYICTKRDSTPTLALAEGDAQVTIITSKGKWNAIAERIHYHSVSRELILEGKPLIMRGRQLLCPSSSDALVRIRLDSDTITSNKP